MRKMNFSVPKLKNFQRYFTGLYLILISMSYSSELLADWQLDSDKSRISFMTTRVSFAQITGGFNRFEGSIEGSPEDPLHTAANFSIKTHSISTGLDIRDNVLRGKAFFNVETYPNMEFKSTKIKKIDATHAIIQGDLTMLGVTRPLAFDVTLDKPSVDGNTKIVKINAVALATMNRYDWGMRTFVPAVGNEITVRVDAVLINNGNGGQQHLTFN